MYWLDFKMLKACYFCDICCMGDDKLVLELKSKGGDDCGNMNVVLKLGFGVWSL